MESEEDVQRQPKTFKAGDWYAMCCYLDINQVEDDEDAASLNEHEEEIGVWFGPYATYREILEELLRVDGAHSDGPTIRAFLAHADCCDPKWDKERRAWVCRHSDVIVASDS